MGMSGRWWLGIQSASFVWRSRIGSEAAERVEALCIPLLRPVWMKWRAEGVGVDQDARWTLFPRLQWWRRSELQDKS